MTDKTPADWVLIEAAKQSGWNGLAKARAYYEGEDPMFRALCDMIEKYEQPPVDRKVLCAREAVQVYFNDRDMDVEGACIRAIELWEGGFGK